MMDNYFQKIASSILLDCYQKERVHITNFLTTEEQEILLIEKKHYPTLKIDFETGFKGGERKKAIIYSNDGSYQAEITVLKLTYGNKYKDITHRHILGNLMALGIDRNRVGDIILYDGYAFVAVDTKLVSFLKQEFKTLNKLPLLVEDFFDEVEISDNGIEKKLFVSSLRADAVIAASFNLSREKVSELFEHEFVKINQKVVYKIFKEISVNDLISVKHYGRIKILDNTNKTRSGKFVLQALLYK